MRELNMQKELVEAAVRSQLWARNYDPQAVLEPPSRDVLNCSHEGCLRQEVQRLRAANAHLRKTVQQRTEENTRLRDGLKRASQAIRDTFRG